MRSIARVLIGVVLLSGSNIPWAAMAAAPSGGGSATSLWGKVIQPITAGAGSAVFSATLTQLRSAESKAFDAMVAEKPYLMKSRFLYSMFIERLLTVGLKPIVAGRGDISSASPSQNKAAYTSGTLEKWGLPKEAYDDALLYKIALAMETAGQQLKPMTEQRKTAEAKVSALLAALQTAANTDSEKIAALGSDAIVHIRRFTAWPMHTIIPDLKKNPECAGDLFKDQSLFADLHARVSNSRRGIVDGGVALFTVLKCADLVQTGSLDSGITLEWIRLHEVFADPKFDLARNRIREWLFGMALMVGDVHQTIGMTGAQALVQLAGDARLVGPGSWLVRDGVNFYNTGSGVLDHFTINEEVYIPKAPPPMNTSFKPDVPDLTLKLNQAVMDAQKQVENGTKVIKLSDIQPFEFLDLTTPYGFTFRDLQGSCTSHPAILPVAKAPAGVRPGGPGYSITDFITISAPDRAGMGLCSKKEMLGAGGYCKRVVCEPPQQFFAPPAPPMDDGLPKGSVCSLPVAGMLGQCEVGQQISQEIHAMATDNGGCPMNPWKDDGEAAPTAVSAGEGKSPKEDEDDKAEKNKEKEKADKPEKPGSVPADATDWQCDADGCAWYSPSQGLGGCIDASHNWGCGGNGNGLPGGTSGSGSGAGVAGSLGSGGAGRGAGGAPGGKSGGSGPPASAQSTPVPGGGRSGSGNGGGTGSGGDSRNSSVTTRVVSLPEDTKKAVTDPNATGGVEPKQETGLLEKFFEKFSNNMGPTVGKILGKMKFKGASQTSGLFGEAGSNCQFSKDPVLCDVLVAYTEAYSETKVEMAARSKQAGNPAFFLQNLPGSLTTVLNGFTGDIKTFDDVEKIIKLTVFLGMEIGRLLESGKVNGMTSNEAQRAAGMAAAKDLLDAKLVNSNTYGLYRTYILKRANDVLQSPQFNAVAKSAFASGFGVANDAKFSADFDKALKKAVNSAEALAYFDYTNNPPSNKKNKTGVLGHAVTGAIYQPAGIRLYMKNHVLEAYKFNDLPIRDVLVSTQVHEMLHHVSFGLEADGYLDQPVVVNGFQFDRIDHAAMYRISMALGVSIENYVSGRIMGPGYTNFDHLFYDDVVFAPPSKKNFGASAGGDSSGSGGAGKDCPPGAPCGGCQMTSYKTSLAAKCSGALAIKNPLTPVIKPLPDSGGGQPANDAYQAFMNCIYPDGGGQKESNDKCINVICSEANSAHECCAGRGKADPAAVKMTESFIKSCGAVKCVEGSTNPCCPQSAVKRSVSAPALSAPLPIDTRRYVPYQESRRTDHAPPAR